MGFDCCVLDVETTGLSAARHELIEIAAVKVRDGRIIDQFHTLIKPNREVSRGITRITGISSDMLQDAPVISEIMQDFLHFVGEDILVGHNVRFDVGFLQQAALMQGEQLANPTLCTCRLSRRLFSFPRYNLATACDELSIINDQAHRALADTLATQQLLSFCIDALKDRQVVQAHEVLKFQYS